MKNPGNRVQDRERSYFRNRAVAWAEPNGEESEGGLDNIMPRVTRKSAAEEEVRAACCISKSKKSDVK
jgi:hypothetical protein